MAEMAICHQLLYHSEESIRRDYHLLLTKTLKDEIITFESNAFHEKSLKSLPEKYWKHFGSEPSLLLQTLNYYLAFLLFSIEVKLKRGRIQWRSRICFNLRRFHSWTVTETKIWTILFSYNWTGKDHLPVSLPTPVSLLKIAAFILLANICIPKTMIVTWMTHKRETSSMWEPCPKAWCQ